MGQIREDAALAHNLDGLILSLAWDPTGSLLAVGRDEDILVFQQPGLQPVTQLPVGSLTAGLAFDPLLPNHLVSGSNDGQIRLWDVADGRVLQTLEAYPKGVTQIAFQPGGELLASAGNGALVYLWDLQSGEQVDSLIGGAFAVPDLAFVPDGSRIVSVDGGVIRVREVATGRLVYSLRAGESVPAIAVSPDGRSVAASRRPGALQLWDLESGELIWEQAVNPDSTAWTLAFNPAGDLLASGWRDGSLCWLDPQQPEGAVCQPAHTRPVGVVLFSPDGRSMLSGGYDGWLRFWAASP
jgi:WD40 repeat protein